jgi:hypothetical protein
VLSFAPSGSNPFRPNSHSKCSPRRTGAAVLDAARDGEPVFAVITAVTLPPVNPSKSKPVKVSKSKRVSGASRPPRLRIAAYGRVIGRDHKTKAEQPLTARTRPIATGGMCYAQRMDLQAAIAGKITWEEYDRKWGARSLSP